MNQLQALAMNEGQMRTRIRLKARVVIYAYNHHVRLLSPEPLVVKQPQFTRVEEPTLLCNHVRLPRLPAARSFGLKTSFLSVINKRRRDKAEHNPCGAVDRPRSAKGAVIF
jgi:hypothetical protein